MLPTRPFSKILIANRGEIVVRVMKTARQLGFRTVAVYSDADCDALHVQLADEAINIGPPAARESYLDIERLIAAARASGAGAVHPGYGFLAENAGFAQACATAGLVFIGPDAPAIALMGNKAAAKRRMQAADVPCIPGFSGEDQTETRLLDEARKIGFPLMVKAAAGGGGRGMRLVHAIGDLPAALRSARSESQSAFGNGDLILERALIEPRHIEIQVFADRHGNVVHLGERDCSIQRRHQKVIEEAPSPAVSTELRTRMGTTAVAAARAIDYVGAGTIEFLLAATGEFYFMEMNTRLQVEHAVTEAITGLDLVEWQLRVGAGERLPLEQHEIAWRGHAIEARLYAEDPAHGFLPQTGTVLTWRPANRAGVRVDHGLRDGAAITPYYDPMIAKIVGQGTTRDEARRRLIAGLEDSVALGVVTNKRFLLDCLEHPAFIDGRATTGFIAAHLTPEKIAPPTRATVALAVALFHERACTSDAPQPELANWHSSASGYAPWRLTCGKTTFDTQVRAKGIGRYLVTLGDDEASVTIIVRADDTVRADVDGTQRNATYGFDRDRLYLEQAGAQFTFDSALIRREAAGTGAALDGQVRAPMNGKVVALAVKSGDTVRKGQALVVLESMKMEHPLVAPYAGQVTEVHAVLNAQVAPGKVLVHIAPVNETEKEQIA